MDQSRRAFHPRIQTGNLRKAPEHVEPELAPDLAECSNRQVLPDGEALEKLVDLVTLGEPDLTGIGDVQVRDVAAIEHDFSGSRNDLAGQHLEEGGLAGAVRSDDASNLTVVD